MKELFNDLKVVMNDPDNRGMLRAAKWLTIIFCIGAIPGLTGILLALIIAFSWSIPKK